MPEAAPFRAGLIGYGSGGRVFHAPLLGRAGITLAAVATRRADAVAADWPDAVVHADAASLLADRSLDLVIVSTPSPTHAAVAMAAREAGHNVVGDKPFAATVAEADALIAAAGRAGVKLSVFHNRRWDSDFLTIRDLVARGVLGTVHHYRAHFEFFKPEAGAGWKNEPAPGVGVHFDLGTHLVDQALDLFGMPEAVWCDLSVLRPGGTVPDTMQARLVYPRLRVTLEASMMNPDQSDRFVVHGDRGSYRRAGMDGQEAQLKAGMHATDPAFGVEDPARDGLLTLAGEAGPRQARVPTLPGCHWQFYALMREAIVNGGPVPVAPEAARDGLRVIAALERSAAEGRRVAP